MQHINNAANTGAGKETPLSYYYERGAHLTALTTIAYALWKTHDLAQSYTALETLTLTGLHLPLTLFCAAFTLLMINKHKTIGTLALIAAVVNAFLLN